MEYFILKPDGEQTGTFSIEEIRSMLNSGFIGEGTRYWHDGIADWQPIDRIEESVNFPEPDPRVPHTPPPHKWTGSLARAIPSPHQKRQSGPVAMPTKPSAPEAPAVPEPQRPAATIPTPTLRIETQPLTDLPRVDGLPTTNGPTRREIAAAAELLPPAPSRRFRMPRIPRPSAAQISAVASFLLAAAIIAAIVLSRHPAKSALSHVTITSDNDCVMTDQAAVGSVDAAMRSMRALARLKRVINKSTDPSFIQSANAGLQQENLRHQGDVTEQFLKAGRAEVIEPGTYSTVAYLDNSGAPVVPHVGAPWVALTYKGTVVYAYLGTDFKLAPPPTTPASQ